MRIWQILFLLAILYTILFLEHKEIANYKTQIVSLQLDVIELKRFQSNLAAGLLDLHQKDEYVEEVMNESREQ